jgi:tetratricopeptide (TPR) repeat protein
MPQSSGQPHPRYLFVTGPVAPYLVLLAIVAVVFANSLGHEFVWDDQIYLLNKPVYRTIDLSRIFGSLVNDLEYLPIRDLSYAIDWAIWGRNPFGFHLTNLLIYAVTVLLVYRLTARLIRALQPAPATAGSTAPLLTAALFAVQPIHAEVVNFITGRNALLSGFFSLLACLAFLAFLTGSRHPRLCYAGTLLCFVLALFSKATALPLPFLLILCVLQVARERRLPQLISVVPFLVVAAGTFLLFRSIAMRSFLLQADQACFTPACLAHNLAIATQIPFFYLGKLLLPLRLTPEYVVDFAPDLASLPVMSATLGLAGLLGVAWWQRRRQPQFLFGLGWFLLALLPVLHFFPTYPVVADRYAYLPSFGIAYLLALSLADTRRWPLTRVIAIALVVGWGALTVSQNRIWHSGETLWQHTLTLSPRSVKAYTNLGRIYFTAGRYAEAFSLFDQARQIEPSDPHYDFFSGLRFFLRADYQQALPHFYRALNRADGFLEALFHAAMAHESLGHRDQAIALFTRTLQSKQDDLGGFRAQAKEHLRQLEQRR